MYIIEYKNKIMEKSEVYEAVNSEKIYAMAKWGNSIPNLDIIAHYAIDVEKHLNKFKEHCYNMDYEAAKHEMRKITYLGVKYAEHHGMPEREF